MYANHCEPQSDRSRWLASDPRAMVPETDYGRYLGQRYRRFRNIVWFHGNDFQSWRIRSDTELVQAVARGIEAAASTHLHTSRIELPRQQLSR